MGEAVILYEAIRKHVSDVTKTHVRSDGGPARAAIKPVNTRAALPVCRALVYTCPIPPRSSEVGTSISPMMTKKLSNGEAPFPRSHSAHVTLRAHAAPLQDGGGVRAGCAQDTGADATWRVR